MAWPRRIPRTIQALACTFHADRAGHPCWRAPSLDPLAAAATQGMRRGLEGEETSPCSNALPRCRAHHAVSASVLSAFALALNVLASHASAAESPPPPATGPAAIYESTVPPCTNGRIDQLVFAGLGRLGVTPVLCSDAVFVRRVHLDVLGTLPTAQEARIFLENPSPDKRRRLIDQLLERPEFADYCAMKWGDLLRIKAEFPVNLWPNAAQAYHRWVHTALAENKPYDRFVRELLTASGSNFRVGPVNFYRAVQNRTPDGIASAVALTFMGTRTDPWPSNRLAGMAKFFTQIGYKPTGEWKEELVFWDPLGLSTVAGSSAPGRANLAAIGQPSNCPPLLSLTNRATTTTTAATFPDGRTIDLPPDRDPREVFADWLIRPDNPWFARCVVNRVWAWLVGRGIIHEPDNIRSSNPPSHPTLLHHLEREFVANHYNLRQLYRLILNSETYQLSSIARSPSPQAPAWFASYPVRRLEAEVLIDAINQVTGASDLYTSPIPEPFTYIPENVPAKSIADGSITSPFLALFGRSARATGMDNERNHRPVPAQWLHLLNSSHIQRKLEQGPNLQALITADRPAPEILEELYLTVLSRRPTPDEVRIAKAYGAGASDPGGRGRRRESWIDLAWALINSTEFAYRH